RGDDRYVPGGLLKLRRPSRKTKRRRRTSRPVGVGRSRQGLVLLLRGLRLALRGRVRLVELDVAAVHGPGSGERVGEVDLRRPERDLEPQLVRDARLAVVGDVELVRVAVHSVELARA